MFYHSPHYLQSVFLWKSGIMKRDYNEYRLEDQVDITWHEKQYRSYSLSILVKKSNKSSLPAWDDVEAVTKLSLLSSFKI